MKRSAGRPSLDRVARELWAGALPTWEPATFSAAQLTRSGETWHYPQEVLLQLQAMNIAARTKTGWKPAWVDPELFGLDGPFLRDQPASVLSSMPSARPWGSLYEARRYVAEQSMADGARRIAIAPTGEVFTLSFDDFRALKDRQGGS